MPYVKNKIRVNVPKRSGFDKSHRSSGTSFCGTLTPLMVDELIPGSRVSLRLPINVQMPPLVSQTFMNVKYKVEAFFVPYRLTCASFEDFFCDFPTRVFSTTAASAGQFPGSFDNVNAALPVFSIPVGSVPSVAGPGSLLDFLGVKVGSMSGTDPLVINPLPLVAYHLIWQEWYRNPRVQNPAFSPSLGLSPNFANVGSNYGVAYLPYNYFHRAFTRGGSGTSVADNSVIPYDPNLVTNFYTADGLSIFSLRQRNFGLDYFTGSRVSAQQGNASAVTFNTSVSGTADSAGAVTGSGSGSISIAALRAANSLQQFRERNNIPSPRLVDQVKARYGANLSDGVAQRPICIGSASYNVASRGVDQQSPSDSTDPGVNPFSGVAAEYGRGSASGNDFIIKDFVVNEPGLIMVIGSLVPEVTYSSGINPIFKRYLTEGSITDMACSLLQNVGDQPIYVRELNSDPGASSSTVFGYTDRYADFMFKPNECHGLFRDGQSLDSFILQRSFSTGATLSSNFLEIPKNYLDGVMTVTSSTSGLSYWYDAICDYKVSMPLAEFSIPSLQDPAYEHGESVVLRRNGQIF